MGRSASPLDSGSIGRLFADAMTAYEDGRTGEARKLALQLAEAAPAFGGAHYLLGLLALDKGRARQAVESLSRAVAATPDEPAPRLAIGRALEQMGNVNTAILHYRHVTAVRAGHAEAHARLGELLGVSGRCEEAIAHCRVAIASDPRHAGARNTLGALLHQAGQDAEAVAHLAEALTVRPDWPAALNNMGVALHALGRLPDALAMLEGAVELRPQHAASRANLACTLRALGRLDEARAQAEKATKQDPRCADAWLELGLARRQAGHTDGAAAAFERAVATAPRSAHAHWCLAEARRVLGDTAKAVRHYRECLTLDPEDRHGAALGLAQAGGAPTPGKAPEAYVRQLFDDYADRFDEALVERLAYRAPALLAEALACTLGGRQGLAVLDAGCGTGLAAPVLRPLAARLDGVDLSPAMVEKARERGLYDGLNVAELVAFLHRHEAEYDLVVAADVLVYLGALDEAMNAAARALKPGGAFAFTVERTAEVPTYMLGPKNRYAHSPAYVADAAQAAGLGVLHMEEAVSRREGGNDVDGLVVVLGK